MSNIVAIAYPDKATAEEVRATLAQLSTEHLLGLEDAVVVTREDNGKVKLHQAVKPGAAGAAGGAVWGGLLGMLFFAPLLGMAVGAAASGAAGAMSDLGINDKFMKELGTKLEPGTAALIVLVHGATPDKVLPRISQYGGDVLQTSLSTDDEEALQEALHHSTAGAA
jgi:uncharacterized membrane protein